MLSEAVRDGWYELHVKIAPELMPGATRNSYLGVHNKTEADAVLANVENELPFIESQPNPDSFDVNIGFSFRASYLFGKRKDTQEFSHLIAVLGRPDGSRDIYLVPVPDRRQSKQIVIDPQTLVLGEDGK